MVRIVIFIYFTSITRRAINYFGNFFYKSVHGGQQFNCQHGPSECKGNMIQSCALNALNGNADAQMEYISCQMKFNAEPTGKNCANLINLNYRYIQQCMVNGIGVQLQLSAEKVTQSVQYPYPSFIPTIIYNGVNIFCLNDKYLLKS